MAFNIVTSELDLPYRFNHSYYAQGTDLRGMGNKGMGFTDVDILEIRNLAKGKDVHEIKFHKERFYPKPDEVTFTIYDVEENFIITELKVILSEKRCFYLANRVGKLYANMVVRIKVTQDPNNKTYLWTGLYS